MGYKILNGDVIEQLKTLSDESVQTVITSPPYWGLRDYGTGKWEGGDAACGHIKTTLSGSACKLRNDGREHIGIYEGEKAGTFSVTPYRDVCGKCGAIRVDNQIGLEQTPQEYVAKMVEVFSEVRRVLRKDGTCWVNLGDSYNSSPNQRKAGDGDTVGYKQASNVGSLLIGSRSAPDLKPKNLVGIPWRVAFALQEDGWYLRQDIIWAKPNPMPESVTDRCTRSHEYMFLLTKSAKYYFDVNSIKEEASSPPQSRNRNKEGYNPSLGTRQDRFSEGERTYGVDGKRQKRDVWTIPTQPYKGAHFAVFPEKLVEPCVLAGSSTGSLVLDPFCGSGTVGVVAAHYERNFVGIELNPEYIELAHARITAGSKKLGKDTNEQSTS